MSECSEIQIHRTRTGLEKYVIEVKHSGLNKYQLIKDETHYVVEQKARAKMAEWDEMWEKKCAAEEKRREQLKRVQEKVIAAEEKRRDQAKRVQELEDRRATAAERTAKAKETLAMLDQILADSLKRSHAVDWESLKRCEDYSVARPEKPLPPVIPPEPDQATEEYQPRLKLWDRLIPALRRKKEQAADERFVSDYNRWMYTRQEAEKAYSLEQAKYQECLKKWEADRGDFLKKRDAGNAAIDTKKQEYLGRDSEAILDYCAMVLSNSKYPDWCPQSYELDYNPETKILVIHYQLPFVGDIPTLTEVKYVQSRDELDEKHISPSQLNTLYDSLLYQIVLRTVRELFEADVADAFSAVVLNGYVHSVDHATGQEVDACVLSLQAGKEEFEQINLAKVEPKACFKKLKGVGSSKLHSLTPIAPLIKIERDDKRFVSGREIVEGIDEGDNLAAMDWEDFEHLIRELFEKEFARAGSEVKVTRASRDGGIDAVAFDPDPLHGGKTVIQAKRYTNTVGVSAVRDLFGAVHNEGANKGILVTTSDYGPDAYEFAKGKPLTLLSGSNLLHLLQKHGYNAKINLAEAKEILKEKEVDTDK